MIIWGSTGKEVDLGSGQFQCPYCGDRQEYKHIRWARYFTLYFMPLFQIEDLGQFIVCQGCQSSFKDDVLESPQQYYGAKTVTKARSVPPAIQAGDRVLAPWSADHFFYPGVVQACENGKCEIGYDDGAIDWVSAEQLNVFDIVEGDRVFARWQGQKFFHAGTIDELDGERVHIYYDDGDQEWTTVAMVRVERIERDLGPTTEVDTRIKES